LNTSVAIALTACRATIPSPQSNAEQESGFTYVPLDPFSVNIESRTDHSKTNAQNSTNENPNILHSLPDNAVRIATEQHAANGSVSYGSASAAVAGSSYRITLDYISSDTVNLKFYVEKTVYTRTNKQDTFSPQYVDASLLPPYGAGEYQTNSEVYKVVRIPDYLANATTNNFEALRNFIATPDNTNVYGSFYNVPIYIGIGLRVNANITSIKGGVNIAGLGAIGAAAGSTNLSGTLVVQTLGVNGKSISAALPIQSQLNQTTAENALVAVGAIKALLYESETVITPRVVGMYLPFSGGKPLVNAIISQISQGGVTWNPKGSN